MAILLATAAASAATSAAASAASTIIVWAGIAPAFAGAVMVVDNFEQERLHSATTVAAVSISKGPNFEFWHDRVGLGRRTGILPENPTSNPSWNLQCPNVGLVDVPSQTQQPPLTRRLIRTQV